MTVAIAVGVMLVLCLMRLNVILALMTGAIVGGLSAHMQFSAIVSSFTHGVSHAAAIALSYGVLGAFANALSYSGIGDKLTGFFQSASGNGAYLRFMLIFSLLLMGIASQNIIPIHIAFIPIIIPPLLRVFNKINIDRRLIACVITFGITCTYITVPVGFGSIYLYGVLGGNLASNGLPVDRALLPLAMLIPASGMVVGLLLAVFFSYRKKREYADISQEEAYLKGASSEKRHAWPLVISIIVMVAVQLMADSMIMGAMAGCLSLCVFSSLSLKKADAVLMEGFKMMAPCGFIMMAASGFAAVLQDSNTIPQMVQLVSGAIASKGLLVFLMLFIGLLITMGIGSSFSTVPVLAAIYVPVAISMGLSPMATIALVGTAGALGDAGSPASESTIGPTAGLNMDGQHDHMRDTVIPTFLHYNIPLLITGWIGVMVL